MALKSDGTVVTWGVDDGGENAFDGITDIVQMTASGNKMFVLTSGGMVYSWPESYYGQYYVPENLSDVIDISAGNNHTLALKSDGTVIAWEGYGNEISVPEDLSDVVDISAGWYHSLALKSDGTVIVWGESNPFGELNVPSGLSDVVQVLGGQHTSTVLKSDGTVVNWGKNDDVPIWLSDVISIQGESGSGQTLALKANGELASWGPNTWGQLNVGTELGYIGYVQDDCVQDCADEWGGSLELDCAGVCGGSLEFDCAGVCDGDGVLDECGVCGGNGIAEGTCDCDGNVLDCHGECGGDSAIDDCGNCNFFENESAYINECDECVGGISIGYPSMASGQIYNVILRQNGTVWVSAGHSHLQPPSGLSDVIAVESGYNIGGNYSRIMALKSDGTVITWGIDDGGENAFDGIADIVQMTTHGSIMFVRTSGGMVYSWPESYYGQYYVPENLSDVIDISAGNNHTLALKSDGTVIAWEGYGNEISVPEDLSDVVDISAGWYHSLALKSDGTVIVWGESNPFGELNVPSGLSDVVQVLGGQHTSTVLKSDGTVVNWGKNDDVPIWLSDVISIQGESGSGQTLALKANGELASWGPNTWGQLNVGTELGYIGYVQDDCVQDCADEWGGSLELDCAGVCGGSLEFDCAGVCDGDGVLDECGVCGGNGIAEGTCDCDGNVLDCDGECGGDSAIDECGNCNFFENESAYINECDECVGGISIGYPSMASGQIYNVILRQNGTVWVSSGHGFLQPPSGLTDVIAVESGYNIGGCKKP
jgi:alpha-tubulin suppressor-like RCC1 family protein